MPKLGMEPIRKAALVNATITEIGRVGSLDVTVSQIAKRAGMSSALAHHYFGSKDDIFLAAMRHVLTLYGAEVRGALEIFRRIRDDYGLELAELAATANDPLIAAAGLILPRLREITGESVQLYRREGTQRICVASMEPPTGLRDTVLVGARLPMNAGSGAKVLLAWADPQTQRTVLADASFGERVLLEVRRRGWAQSAAEREPGVASVAAPVRDSAGAVIAAISVSGPIDRMGRRPGARWAADLLAAAEALHKRL